MDDSLRTCVDCGTTFIWTAGEQMYFAQHQLKPPKRCLPCRKARVARRQPKDANRDTEAR